MKSAEKPAMELCKCREARGKGLDGEGGFLCLGDESSNLHALSLDVTVLFSVQDFIRAILSGCSCAVHDRRRTAR